MLATASRALDQRSRLCTLLCADLRKVDGSASAASVGAAQVAAPLDEEAVGKAGAPERTGVPRDPANAKTKSWCYRAVLVAGFALAIDFTMSLMSIQVRSRVGCVSEWGYCGTWR